MLLSYIVGRIYHPVAYPHRSIIDYFLMATALFAVMNYGRHHLAQWLSITLNAGLILLFVIRIVYHDFPLSSLPVVGKYFRKNNQNK